MLSHGIHKPRLRPTLAALAIAAASVLLFASPASAHDELVGTDPAADAVVTVSPAALTLTFSGELIAEEGATEVAATDASGASLVDGAPSVEANVVTQPLIAGGSGVVQVLWKVVSGDGHPISGEFSFTVDAPAPAPTATETTTEPTPTTEPTADQTASATPLPTETAAPEAGIDAGIPWVIGGVLVLGIGGAVAYLLISRRRRENALARAAIDDPAAASDDPLDR